MTSAAAAAGTPIEEPRERRVAWRLALLVLATLTVVKPIGGIPYIGAVALTVAAVLQLYLPLWRIDVLKLDHDFIGLHTRALGRDLKIVLVLCLITFPPYVVGHHLYMTAAHGWAESLGWDWLLRWLPLRELDPRWPAAGTGWLVLGWAALKTVATHSLGVALPEETFYRGYLQPRLEALWPPARRVLGVPIGRAAVVASALFALGHFLGEWNPLRLGPFFPGLIFAWQRNATGSVVGAITYHALCNILGELLFALYAPA